MEGSGLSTCYPQVSVTVSNLYPSGPHGFHVHTYEELSGDRDSSGGHFISLAGDDISHGYAGNQVRHLRDFENLATNAAGSTDYIRIDKVVRFGGIVGYSMIFPTEADKVGC